MSCIPLDGRTDVAGMEEVPNLYAEAQDRSDRWVLR